MATDVTRTALWTALNKLGIPTYHTMDAMQNGDIPFWNEALAARYAGDKAPYDADDWAKILWSYEGIIDAPAIFFMEEWLAQNPEAKVMLNKRSFEGWYRSVSNTGMPLTSWKWWPLLRPFLNARDKRLVPIRLLLPDHDRRLGPPCHHPAPRVLDGRAVPQDLRGPFPTGARPGGC